MCKAYAVKHSKPEFIFNVRHHLNIWLFFVSHIQLFHAYSRDILNVSSCICCSLLKVFIESLTTLVSRRETLVGFGQILGPVRLARAGWVCLGPDATASVQAWQWDICGARAHQLLSPCRRQLYLNIHTKCRLICVCLAPHGVPSNGPDCDFPLRRCRCKRRATCLGVGGEDIGVEGWSIQQQND